ncbi:hypothetical protein [Waddlia chondrophila]|uniref:Putative membrane protein n=1 Tax=Waddlia chondrophila (strain ATCC VR-1470 / WSU 86-1044) TaxID=716544 RepID=D6YU35_WADCW|nr:hypothetical protein [Waddlia chondrophila]ADI37646.1 putative membrane protein [Waddlia chondrophila WSU 86-1044]
MKKRLLLIIPLVLLAFAGIFRHAILGNVLTYTANRYTLNKFGVPLEFEKISKKGRLWEIRSLAIKRSNLSLTADKLEVAFEWHPLGGYFFVKILVRDSEIAINEQAADFSSLLADLLPNRLPIWMLNVQTVCEISNGRVSWIAKGGEAESAVFELQASSGGSRQDLELSVWLDEEVRGRNAFCLSLTKDDFKGLSTGLTFYQVECGKVARGFEALGRPLKGWEIQRGMIDGNVELAWPSSHAPYAIGKASVTDLRFDHPESKTTGEVREAVLDLHMRHIKGEMPSLEGKVEFTGGTSLAFQRKGEPFWKIDNLSGGLYFEPERAVMINMGGKCSHELCDFCLSLDGKAQLVDKQKASLDLAVRLFSEGGKEAAVRFIAEQLGPKEHQAELFVENVGPAEFAFVQEALARYSDDWNGFHIQKGLLDAEGLVSMVGWQLTDLDIRQLKVEGMEVDVPSLDLSANIEKVTGGLAIHLLEEEPLRTIDADFFIDGGCLVSQTLSGSLCCLNDVRTELKVRQGVIQQSEMRGEFAGLKGTVGIDWTAKDKIVQAYFSGPSERLAPFLPAHFRSPFLQSFSSNDLEIKAGVVLKNEKLAVKGEARMAEQTVAFGFHLEKSSEKLWKSWPANHLAASYWDNVGAEVMKTVVPPIASPAVLFEANWIRAETGIAGLVLRNGWFKAKEVDLERFVAPFLFSSSQMQLSGRGSFIGGFNQNVLTVEYEAQNVVMGNRFMEINAEHIDRGVHYFDFKKGVHFGSIPLSQAVYTEKNTGLVFTPVDMQVAVEGEKMHLAQIDAECCGMRMAGEIDIDFGKPDDGVFDLEIRVRNVKGGLKNVQDLLARFHPDLWLLQLPVDGQFELKDEGAFFKLSFTPEDYAVEAVLKGKIQEAFVASGPYGRGGLSGLQLQFGYDHLNRLLEISHLQADIYVDDQFTGYRLYGDHLSVDDLEEGRSSFDFWVGDQNRDLIRFVGRTQQEMDPYERPYIAVHIDHHLTHLGNIHPSSFLLRLKSPTVVDQFQIGMQVDLEALFNDLFAVSCSGGGSALEQLGKEIQWMHNPAGTLDVQLHYDLRSNSLIYRIDGSGIEMNQLTAKKMKLAGSKSQSKWIVDQLQWDEKVIAGEFMPEGERWKIEGFQFRDQDILALNFDGYFIPARKKLDARVNEVQIDLAQVSGTAEIEQFRRENDPHGKLTGYGNLSVEWGSSRVPWKFDAILDVALEQWDLKGIRFDDAHNISCHYISGQGMTMRKLRTKMLDKASTEVLAQVDIEKIQYDFSTGEVLFDELAFAVPADRLPRFSAQLERSFPNFVTPVMAEIICSCKQEGVLKGVMQYELTPPYTAMKLTLEDGIYNFLNAAHKISGFVMDYDPFEFSVVSGYRLAGRDVWLYARSSSPSLAYGELVLTDQDPEKVSQQRPKEALYFDWENNSETGICFTHIEGSYQGLQMELEKDPTQAPSKEALFLVGTVGIHGQKAKEFFPEQMADKFVAWQVGEGYSLQGKWRFLKNYSENYGDKLHFVGMLKGSDFHLKGYQLDSLQAHLEYTPTAIRINDLVINDRCGVLTSDRIDILKTDLGTWAFAMPLMIVNQFRPSLLQEEGFPRPTARKPMVVQELILEKTQGNLSDSRTMIGRGSLYFTNRSKKFLQDTIFQIPSDILSRIGLDSAVLTPVSGTIEYEIHDGRIYLTRFKEMYSDAKLSKFYLASSPSSTVDFDGGLNVQVRMKQYNLIFKLAELFTFNIQGDLKNPVYSIQKQ